DLVDDDRANGWIRIGQAGAHPELLHGARIVLAEAEMTHGRNVGVTGAGNIAAERNAVVGRAEIDTATVAGESPAGISGEEVNGITLGSVEAKVGRIAGAGGIEAAGRSDHFVENFETG